MLITFKTEKYASITFFGDVAITFLKIMGHSIDVPGAILADDVPEALGRLSAAIDAEPLINPAPVNAQDEEDRVPLVSLRQRGLPLVALLKAAVSSGSNVMWE